MDKKGLNREDVERLLNDAFAKDLKFADGRILCSMNTEPHELAKAAHNMFIEANLGNPRLYKGTMELEQQVIDMLSSILHGENIHGSIVNGGTEANITALWLAKKYTGRSEVIYPESVHFSIQKAVDLLGLIPVPIGLDENYRMDTVELETKLSGNTAAVVAMAGTTELGVIDPIEQISELTKDNCFLHIDAAFGGMVIPFLKELGYDLPDFDFSIPGVDSIAVDPHKMGAATIPSGAFLIRDKKLLDNIAVETPYLTVNSQSALSSTRNSASVAATYAVMKHLGFEGYSERTESCMEVTRYFQQKLKSAGFELVTEPVMNIIAVSIEGAAEIERTLASNDWWISKTRSGDALRFVIMPHVTREVIDHFMPALIQACNKV